MKFSPKTIELLKSFSTINSGLYFKKGKQLRTISPQKNILCEAVIEDEIPQDFVIYDLNKFLTILSIEAGKEPEIEFIDDKNAKIKYDTDTRKSVFDYRFAELSSIVSPPDKQLTLPSVDVTFSLTESDLAWIRKTANILSSPHVAVTGDGEKMSIVCFDGTDNSATTNSVDTGLKTDKRFKLIFKTENLKMIPGAYNFEISAGGIAHLTHSSGNIQYWIATETGSTYEA